MIILETLEYEKEECPCFLYLIQIFDQRLFRLSSVENIRQYFHEVKDFYRNDMSEVGQTPIHFAAMTGQNHFVQNIIERIGAKVLLFRGNVFIKFSGRSESRDHSYCAMCALVGPETIFYYTLLNYCRRILRYFHKF